MEDFVFYMIGVMLAIMAVLLTVVLVVTAWQYGGLGAAFIALIIVIFAGIGLFANICSPD